MSDLPADPLELIETVKTLVKNTFTTDLAQAIEDEDKAFTFEQDAVGILVWYDNVLTTVGKRLISKSQKWHELSRDEQVDYMNQARYKLEEILGA